MPGFTRYFSILLFIVFGNQLPAQEPVIKIKLPDGEKTIHAFIKNGLAYAPAKEFAEALGIKYAYSSEKRKADLAFENFSIKITAENPYVVKSAKGSGDVLIQMPQPALYAQNRVYFPVEYLINILKNGLREDIAFNRKNLTLTFAPAGIKGKKQEAEENQSKKEPANETSARKNEISVSEKANGSLVNIRLNKKNLKYESSYKNNQLILTIKGSGIEIDEPESISAKSIIKKVAAKKQGANTRIFFELRPGYESHEITPYEDGYGLLLTIRNDRFKRKTPDIKKKWDFDVIVIDAGHGGKDAGAIGVGGLKEKDVNLAIALKLGKLVESNLKDVKVVYTRKTDDFVELYKRGKIANESNGKLFISIHCNSTPQKPTDASGTEIYLLRPGRTESAIKIAERENSVIKYEDNPSRYQKLTDENFILVSMAHSSYMKYSEKFSDYLNNNFLNAPSIKSRGVKQAGFYVLIGASMPGVLVETGFISNPHDADMLRSKDGQAKVAGSIYEAVKKFKDYYDKAIETDS